MALTYFFCLVKGCLQFCCNSMQCLCFRLIKYHRYDGIVLSKIWLLGHCQDHLTSESQICPWLFCSQWKLTGHHSPYDVVSTPLSFLPCFSTSLWQRKWVRCWRTEVVFQAICQQVLNNNGICLLTNWAIEFRHWGGHLCDLSQPQMVNHLKRQNYRVNRRTLSPMW